MQKLEIKYLQWFERIVQKASDKMESPEFVAHDAIEQLLRSHLSLDRKIRILQELKKVVKSMDIDAGAKYSIVEEEIAPLSKELQGIEKQQLKISWKKNPSKKKKKIVIVKDYHEAWKAFRAGKIKIDTPFKTISYGGTAKFIKLKEPYELDAIGLPKKYKIIEVKYKNNPAKNKDYGFPHTSLQFPYLRDSDYRFPHKVTRTTEKWDVHIIKYFSKLKRVLFTPVIVSFKSEKEAVTFIHNLEVSDGLPALAHIGEAMKGTAVFTALGEAELKKENPKNG